MNASTGYGSFNTSDTTIGVSGGSDLVSYSVQAGYLNTDGFNAIHNQQSVFYDPDRDGYYNRNLMIMEFLMPGPML